MHMNFNLPRTGSQK